MRRFNAADADALATLYAPSAVNHQVAENAVEGRDAIHAILEWRDPLGLRGCGFFHIQGDAIVSQRGYWDELSFLRMHGLPIPMTEETP